MPIADERSALPLCKQEKYEQDDQRIDVSGLAEDIEREMAEDRLHHDALKAIGAAGDFETVRDLAQDQRDAERHHQAREIAAAQHKEAGDKTQEGRRNAGDEQRQQRLGDDAVFRQKSRRIGTEPEECRMPERDDARIAEQQVKREREQREDRDFGQDQVLARQQEDRRDRHKPEHDLQRAPARPRRQMGGGLRHKRLGWRTVHHGHLAIARENNPCGRQISTTIMMV
jgi:hypothetical protein